MQWQLAWIQMLFDIVNTLHFSLHNVRFRYMMVQGSVLVRTRTEPGCEPEPWFGSGSALRQWFGSRFGSSSGKKAGVRTRTEPTHH